MKKKSIRRSVYSFLCVCIGMSTIGRIQLRKTNGKAAQNWVEAKAECVMEMHSRRILYASHADTRLPMASTTKILTAITAIENCTDAREIVTIPAEAVGIEGSSVYLKCGDEYSVNDLLYGLMLRSGNDCATALALHLGGSIESFAGKMNMTAQATGALESRFMNPHGLPQDGHYTTAKDLSLITCYALHDSTFREIVSTRFYEPRNWKNKNKMLTAYDGAIGVKTGYTKQAGRCLVSAATRGNMTLVCTVLGCPTTYERSTALLDDAFAAYRYAQILRKDEVFTVGKEKCVSKEDYFYPLSEGEEALIEIKTFAVPHKKREKIVGQFEIYLSKQLLFSGNLYKL